MRYILIDPPGFKISSFSIFIGNVSKRTNNFVCSKIVRGKARSRREFFSKIKHECKNEIFKWHIIENCMFTRSDFTKIIK